MPIIPFESAILRSKIQRHLPVEPRRPLGPMGMLTPNAQPTIDPTAAWAKLAGRFRPINRPTNGGTF